MAHVQIRRLTAEEAREYAGGLGEVLADCVQGGASVSFMLPFTAADGEGFYRKIAEGIAAGERVLFAAFEADYVVGTVQLVIAQPPNQPHRADVAKLLVRRSARGMGVAGMLMQALEQEAARIGKTVLVLDTVTGGDAEQLYEKLGWTKAGVIPNYALMPDGALAATTIFWKDVGAVRR